MLPFLELDSAIVKDMITVNITAATYLCHQVTNLDDHDHDIKDDTDDHDDNYHFCHLFTCHQVTNLDDDTNNDVEGENYDHNEIECNNDYHEMNFINLTAAT